MSIRLLVITLLSSLSVFTQIKIDFSPEAGVHKGLREVVVQKPSSSKLFYTINGETPTRSSELLNSDKISLHRNTAIRFLMIDKNGNESRFSRTYIIDRTHDLPVFSIITDSVNLFDEERGIYSRGCCAEDEEPYKGANFWKDWEREAQIAFIDQNNKQVIDQQSGIQMFGGFSLGMPQKSFGLYAREKYGQKKFEYSFFKDRPFDEYNNLVLRNAGSDMQGAHIRDAFATTLIKPTGLLVQSYRPVAVYINGVYWGKYNLREKINEHFINQHYGYDTDSLIIMRHKKTKQHGSTKDYVNFWNKLATLDLQDKKDLAYVSDKIDIDNYLLYNTCEIYTGNADAGGNVRYFKHVSDTAKWRWIFYDVDHSMNIFKKDAHLKNSVSHFTTENARDWPHPNWSTLLIRKLLENDSIRDIYVQRFCDQLNTTFSVENALVLLDSLKNGVETESIYHKKRWGVTDQIYDLSFNKLYTHVKQRPDVLIQHLKERFDLGSRVQISVNNTEGGGVRLNSLNIKDSFQGLYFEDVPVRIEAIPEFDYHFVGWKEIDEKSKTIDTALNNSITLTPIFKERKLSSYLNKVIINEIDAEQDSARDSDYIELKNIGVKKVNLSGWIIADEEHFYQIPEGVFLVKDDYLIITEDDIVFKKSFDIDNFLGGLTFGIDKKGELLSLYDNDSLLVDKVSTQKWDKEKKGLSWSRVSTNCENEFYNTWIMEESSPGVENGFCEELYKQRNREDGIKYWLLIAGIVFATLGIGIFLFILMRR